jgi:transposase-like protein
MYFFDPKIATCLHNKCFVAGRTARCAASLIGVNSKTAVYYFHCLREVICYHLELETDTVVGGEIEVDESCFGGRRKRARSTRRSYSMPHQRRYTLSLYGRWFRTASNLIVVTGIMCSTYRPSSTAVSTTPSSLPTSRTTSTVLKTSRTKRSVICENSTVFLKSTLGYFLKEYEWRFTPSTPQIIYSYRKFFISGH